MRRSNQGSTMLEFTLVGIPLIFILISIFELSRGMWIYHTMAYGLKDTARYAAVHGQSCLNASAACPVTVDAVARHLRDASVGVLPDYLQVTFSTNTRTVPCNPLSACYGNTECFPVAADCTSFDGGAAPNSPLTIAATYNFTSAISMFWPTAGRGIVFNAANFPARARELILF